MTTATYAPADADTWWINHVQPTDIHHARTWTRDRLTRKHLPTALIDDAELIASELLTNVGVHAPDSDAELTLHHDPDEGTLTLTCADRAPYTPTVLSPDADDEHHRGLLIVAALAAGWDVRARRDGGKRVIVHLAGRPL